MRKNVAFDSLPIVDRVYRGFKIASMAPAGSPLCVQTDGEVRYRQTASPFGVTEGTVLGPDKEGSPGFVPRLTSSD